MIEVEITNIEKKADEIRKEFERHLSQDVILRATSGAINRALKDGITKGIKPEIKRNFNIPTKYMKNLAKVAPTAKSNRLYGGIQLNFSTIPVVAFEKSLQQTDAGVEFSIMKGKVTLIPHAFIATKGKNELYKAGKKKGRVKIESGNTHVFGRGEYTEKGFVPTKERSRKGKSTLSRMKTASPFTMGLSDEVADNVNNLIGQEVLRGLRGQLQAQIDKLTK